VPGCASEWEQRLISLWAPFGRPPPFAVMRPAAIADCRDSLIDGWICARLEVLRREYERQRGQVHTAGEVVPEMAIPTFEVIEAGVTETQEPFLPWVGCRGPARGHAWQ
jgi:hypothetical protein